MATLPLSGCPLKRLEIHGGPTHNTYDAASLDSSLTATLEAQRSTTRNHGNLLLQSHLGLRRIISIQLADSDATPASQRQIVRYHEPSLKISIQISRMQQTTIFCFERAQDFKNAIAMLKRSGLRLQEGIPLTFGISRATTTSGTSLVPSQNLGPRLSSITPLENEGQRVSQTKFSFTAMLNSDVPLTHLLPPRVQTDPVRTYIPNTNTYISQRNKMYQPRISSPLRYEVPADDGSEDSNLSISNSQPASQPTLLTDHENTPYLANHQPISRTSSQSNHSQLPKASVTSCDASLDYQFSPSSSQESFTSVESSSQATDTTGDDFNSQLRLDFHKLLPQTRSLPFLKGKDYKIVKSKPKIRQNQRLGDSQEKGTLTKSADAPTIEKTKVANSNNIDSQLVLPHTPPQPKTSQASNTTVYRSSPEIAGLSTMLLTDPTLLKRINKATSRIFDQYSEDVSRSRNAAACAKFYLAQIHAVRTEFWLNELNQMG
ncbi:hypothetical protein ACQKWADRAFT_285347 [Trichoderma austrokoningii]